MTPMVNIIFAETESAIVRFWQHQLEYSPASSQVTAHEANANAALEALSQSLQGQIACVVIGNERMDRQSGTATTSDLRGGGYDGPIIVCSNNIHARQEQLQAGGENTFEVEDKKDVVDRIVEILGLAKVNPETT